MEMRASQLRGHRGPYARLWHPAQSGRTFVFGMNDDWYAMSGDNMTFAHYIIWIRMRKTHVQLIDEWRRRMTIRTCKAIKEELMMNCWHPDRVERLLEMGLLEKMW
jgi:hypothetical protein